MIRACHAAFTTVIVVAALSGPERAASYTAAQILGGFDAVTLTGIHSAGGDINSTWITGGYLATTTSTGVNISGNGASTLANPASPFTGYGVINVYGSTSGGGTFNFNSSSLTVDIGGTKTNSFNLATVNTGYAFPAANFTTAFWNPLLALQTSLTGLAANNTAASPSVNQNLTITSTGLQTNADGIAVFDIAATDLARYSSVSISPAINQTVLINVTGLGTGSFTGNMNFSGGDGTTNASNVIWNFGAASSVTLGNWDGMVLAPNATLSQDSGQIDGAIVANVWNQGTNELHYDVISPNTQTALTALTTPATVPEPASAALLGAGLLGLLWLRRRR